MNSISLISFANRFQSLRESVQQRSMRSITVVTAIMLGAAPALGDDDLGSRAMDAVEHGHFSKAIRFLEHIPAEQRTHDEYHLLAYSYFRARKLDHAQALAEELVDKSPSDDESILLLGDILAAKGEWEKALPLYIKSCEFNGAPAERWLRVGQAWQALGRPEKAGQAFDEHQRQLSESR
ncbi:MAG: tetratricopeptide repeat protein [Wenzhouxiangellaceae bacterium]